MSNDRFRNLKPFIKKRKKLGRGDFGIQKRDEYLNRSRMLRRKQDGSISYIVDEKGNRVSSIELAEITKGLDTQIIAGYREKEHKNELRRLGFLA